MSVIRCIIRGSSLGRLQLRTFSGISLGSFVLGSDRDFLNSPDNEMETLRKDVATSKKLNLKCGMKSLPFIFAFLLTQSGCAQSEKETAKVADRIEWLFYSDSSQLILKMNQVPAALINRIQFLYDSLLARDFDTLNIEEQKVFRAITQRKLIANESESWRATDVISGNWALPTRKFMVAVQQEKEILFFYIQGGMGTNLHLVYANLDAPKKLSIFHSVGNAGTFLKYSDKNKMERIRSAKLKSLAPVQHVKILNGRVIDPFGLI